MPVTAIVGTDKGGFVLRSDDQRSSWQIDGPFFKGWKVTAVARTDSDSGLGRAPGQEAGRFFAATASQVYGPALHASTDLENWEQVVNVPAWPKGLDRKLNQIWTLVSNGSRFYAGVDEAGLFVSEDGGDNWSSVEGLNEHATRDGWFPGAGGLCAHSILVDPKNSARVWCGISAVGVFRSDDGGVTWQPRNEGIPCVIEDKDHKDIGCCVHGLVADPDDANTIYRREHIGMFRSHDGGDQWERIENGLDYWFGFPISMDVNTKSLYIIPLESDEYRVPADGKLVVYRSRDNGDSWEPLTNGLPQANTYTGILRGAMDVDNLDPCGIYFGTTSGSIHLSSDGGDSWERLPCTLSRILSVDVFVD